MIDVRAPSQALDDQRQLQRAGRARPGSARRSAGCCSRSTPGACAASASRIPARSGPNTTTVVALRASTWRSHGDGGMGRSTTMMVEALAQQLEQRAPRLRTMGWAGPRTAPRRRAAAAGPWTLMATRSRNSASARSGCSSAMASPRSALTPSIIAVVPPRRCRSSSATWPLRGFGQLQREIDGDGGGADAAAGAADGDHLPAALRRLLARGRTTQRAEEGRDVAARQRLVEVLGDAELAGEFPVEARSPTGRRSPARGRRGCRPRPARSARRSGPEGRRDRRAGRGATVRSPGRAMAVRTVPRRICAPAIRSASPAWRATSLSSSVTNASKAARSASTAAAPPARAGVAAAGMGLGVGSAAIRIALVAVQRRDRLRQRIALAREQPLDRIGRGAAERVVSPDSPTQMIRGRPA